MENQTLNLYTDIYHGAKMGIEHRRADEMHGR